MTQMIKKDKGVIILYNYIWSQACLGLYIILTSFHLYILG